MAVSPRALFGQVAENPANVVKTRALADEVRGQTVSQIVHAQIPEPRSFAGSHEPLVVHPAVLPGGNLLQVFRNLRMDRHHARTACLHIAQDNPPAAYIVRRQPEKLADPAHARIERDTPSAAVQAAIGCKAIAVRAAKCC